MSVEDIRCRRVPRRWIAVGCLLQLAATLVYALVANDLFAVMQSALFAVLCALVQCGLALIKPGALGFGDVTMTLMMGLAVGMTGLTGVVCWWLAMGVLGLVWIVLWRRFDGQRDSPYAGKAPFAPVILLAAVLVLPLGL